MNAETSPGEANMDVEKQDSSICNVTLHPEDAPTLDRTAKEPAPTSDNAVQQPVKRPTRQWAAWTREEEESFFTALRQVGKNFEKITCRVQSKNKDQVRHYYYRLVRRMNKILGSRLCLDAKNSKDTNAAMLKWWSLLEKYSFKASKLHLKPRRFKIFVEALEHQLLKERKKNTRKRSQGENLSPSPCTLSSQSRSSGHDNHAVKMVLVDSQNIQKLGPGKPSFKRNVSFGTTHGNNKGESNSVKQPRRRRKPGLTSSSAYKKWEKAAIAGVSLVADAAEHVERTAADAAGHVQADAARSVKRTAAVELVNPLVADGPGHIKPTAFNAANHLKCRSADDAKDVTCSSANKDDQTDQSIASKDSVGVLPPLPPVSRNHLMECVQSCTKLKLQLFPIDDGTRRALEMDKHNPHLELTLSTRKKISSVLEHLNRKWGSSNVARGEIMLFPYGVQQGNPQTCTRWTQDSLCSAADVYSMIGSPPVFRLWYGWFTRTGAPVRPSCFPAAHESPVTNNCSSKVGGIQKEQLLLVNENHDILTGSCDKREQVKNCADETVAGLCRIKEIGDTNLIRSDMDDPRTANDAAISAVEWADSLTNISVGDLLVEVAQSEEADCAETSLRKNPQCSQHYSISCDSFDAAVAAHMSKYQDKGAVQSTFSSHLSSSIWDAEETCDAFSFQKAMAGNASSGAAEGTGRPSPSGSDGFIEELREVETDARNPSCNAPVEDYMSDDQIIMENATKDFSELTDLYWPESLGPLDLDIPAPNFRSEDMILSDSLSCLNRLIATSLDAFQSCSFFGVDKKEPEPTAIESRDNAPPFRISS